MPTITLDEIQTDVNAILNKIAAFERQPAAPQFPLTLHLPVLTQRETYVGTIVTADGTRAYHLILLAEQAEDLKWKAALAWAESIGGQLPDRVESALLFAHSKDQFKPEAYWTREQHEDTSYAWSQCFYGGSQNNNHTRHRVQGVCRPQIAHLVLYPFIHSTERSMKPSELKAQYLADHLKPGEQYAGLMLGKNGEPDYHLVLLPGEPTDDLNWKAAKDWAKRIGGELPTRREQSLLYANLKEAFQHRAYWSCEAYEGDSKYAWCQGFDYGTQYHLHTNLEFRACAVRRLPI